MDSHQHFLLPKSTVGERLVADKKALNKRLTLVLTVIVGMSICPTAQAAECAFLPLSPEGVHSVFGQGGSLTRACLKIPSRDLAAITVADGSQAQRILLSWNLWAFIWKQVAGVLIEKWIEKNFGEWIEKLKRLVEMLPDTEAVAQATCLAMQKLSDSVRSMEGITPQAKHYAAEFIQEIRTLLGCNGPAFATRFGVTSLLDRSLYSQSSH